MVQRSGWGDVRHGEEPPLPGHTLEGVQAAFGELDARAQHEVADGARDEYFPGLGKCADPGTDVHGESGYVVSAPLALTGVQACANAEPDPARIRGDPGCATNCTGGSVEDREKPVTQVLDLLSFVSNQLCAHEFIVLLEHRAPCAVADFGGPLGGADDVGE